MCSKISAFTEMELKVLMAYMIELRSSNQYWLEKYSGMKISDAKLKYQIRTRYW